jgi:penicillin amidase
MGETALGALGEADLYAAYASSVFVTQQQQALRDLLETPRAPFFGAGPNDNAASKRDQAVRAALTKTATLLGADTSKWRWGRIHTLTYNHPLAGIDPRFDIGSFPAKGDAATPLIGGFFLHAGLLAFAPDQIAAAGGVNAALAQDALQVVRAIWEPSSRSRSLVTLSTGESGDPRTRHFADQAKAWREGKYLQLPFAP